MSDLADVSRKLVAVFAADVEGYSRLMGTDEVGTLKGLTERRAILDRLIGEHRGRIANTAGDSVLAEFGSAVDAVKCAVDAQAALAEANSSLPSERRINFRMGVHIGDVMVRAGDLFGDGVNIAARLQTLAEPGSVCVSAATYDQVRKVLPITFVDLGPRDVKNIQEPIRVYQVGEPSKPFQKDATARRVETTSLPPLPDKPSIAVLPFQNMSGDPEQEYFADGMVEDIITALSRFKSLFVIARNSTFTYKGKAVDIKQVGRDLGVRYVLEGGVRKAGGRVRVTGQLIEAQTGHHIWADKFDGAMEDVFTLQDQVTSDVVGLIVPTVQKAEIERANRKPTDRLDSYDHLLRGLALIRHRSLDAARKCFREAIAKDPRNSTAYAQLALTYMFEQAASGLPLSAGERAEALRLADAAARYANNDALPLSIAGHVIVYIGRDYDRGFSMTTEAVSLNSNLSSAWYSQGWVSLMCEEAERSVDAFERMLRLSPLDPQRAWAWNGKAFALFSLGRYVDGCEWSRRAVHDHPDVHSLGALIINSIGADRRDDAREAALRLLGLQPDFHASHSAQAFPLRSAASRDQIRKALEAAGLPS